MRRIAYETVLRACGFASLAIFCVMIGMSFTPKLAFQAGGFLTTLMTAILVLKATILRETYLRFALWTSAIAVTMWSIALLLGFTLA
jgi:hypothetical protein